MQIMPIRFEFEEASSEAEAKAEIMLVLSCEEMQMEDVTELIRKKYSIPNVTKEAFLRFERDVKRRVIILDYDEKNGLTSN